MERDGVGGGMVGPGEELVSAWPWAATFHPAWPHAMGSPGLEAQGSVDKGPAPPKLTPVNVSVVCKHVRSLRLCVPPLSTPPVQAGGLQAGLFFLAALSSLQSPGRFQALTGHGF